MATATEAVDVILRDGRTLRLRPPRPDDAESLLDFFRSLSEQSLYLRFHGFPSVEARLVDPLLDPDWEERGALLGTLAENGDERVVAVGNYVRLRDPSLAEAAFAVADEHQRRGIGTRLLEQLADRAGRVGIERFVAEVLPDNRNMLGVFEAAGFELSREFEGGEVEVEFPIASDRGVPRAGRGARPHRGHGVAAARSSSRRASPSSARRAGAARSAASSSATSSRATSRVPRTR